MLNIPAKQALSMAVPFFGGIASLGFVAGLFAYILRPEWGLKIPIIVFFFTSISIMLLFMAIVAVLNFLLPEVLRIIRCGPEGGDGKIDFGFPFSKN
jgi:hypothetical protein